MEKTDAKKRQEASFHAAESDGPTTTTKALLVSVIAPCNFSAKATTSSTATTEEPEDENEGDDEGEAATTAAEEEEEKVAETEDGQVDGGDQQFEEMADQEEAAKDNNVDPELQTTADPNPEELDDDNDAIPIRPEDGGGCGGGEDGVHEVTAEEAAAVKVGEDPGEAEIHVAELLRITFQNLLEECHLLTVPTYSAVEDRKVLAVPVAPGGGCGGDVDYVERSENGEPVPWIRVEAMARPPSLGIILDRLERIGVGTNVGSVSIFQAELCRTASPYLTLVPESGETSATESETEDEVPTTRKGLDSSTSATEKGKEDQSAEDLEKVKAERLIEEARTEWKNAATRLRIEQLREQIMEQAALSFDFIALLSIASTLAGIGLITNNTVVIVASMLVSAIMGPCLGITFGTRVQDWPLVKTSFLNEALSLCGCVIIGLVVGLCAGFTDLAYNTWPTDEMESRGETSGLITGIAIAIPSGMGVCLSILGGNTSSLVGVAISASLLPPAVNAGVCFMQALLLRSGAVSTFGDYDAGDFARIAGISFALTVLNIICIWLSGIVMFEIKEVAPTKSKGAFWDRDIKVARELNRESKAGDKPPPVNPGTLAAGLKKALSKQQSNRSTPIDAIRLHPHAVPRHQPETLNSAFAFKSQRSIGKQNSIVWESDQDAADGYGDNVQYLGMEFISTLFGFNRDDEDEEDSIDPIAITKKIGKGRYI